MIEYTHESERREPAQRVAVPLHPASDWRAHIIAFMVRWASKRPGWRLETMSILARSEAESAHKLEAALPSVNDPRIQGLLTKHLQDEHRHTAEFAGRYESLQKQAGRVPIPAPAPRPQQARMTLLELISSLEIQELRGAEVLSVYQDLFVGDEESVALIEGVARDDKFHSTYSRLQLERWIDEGQPDEVAVARATAARVDHQAFRAQVLGFLRALPSLVLHGHGPPLGQPKPSPL
jgi:hypothetical protein